MNAAALLLPPTTLALEAAFLAVAWRLQLSPSQHRTCEEHYQALARHVDRPGSPLEGKVREVYPSGSFAIRAVILASVSRESHDFDAVLELDVRTDADPGVVLDTLYAAIRGEPGSRYHDKTERNSRCVSVTYAEGVTLDLMPVARTPGGLPRAAVLFHHRAAESGRAEERFHKPVNPWGFANHFNEHVPDDPAFARRAELLREELRRMRVADYRPKLEDKAETQPVLPSVPVEHKPPRVIVLQLLKRFRDCRYRRHDHRGFKRPPSVVLAALALEVGKRTLTLDEELLVVTQHVLDTLREADREGRLLDVRNPVHRFDRFTDRWPSDLEAQGIWIEDLEYLARELTALRNEPVNPGRLRATTADLFGEVVAKDAVEGLMIRQKIGFDRKEIGLDARGRVATVTGTGAAIVTGGATANVASHVQAAPPNTFFGGVIEE